MNLNDLCLGCIKEKGGEKICPHCGYDNSTPAVLPQYIKPGSILNGKFLVGKGLGHGGFGITYLGFDLNLDIKVAIKEYLPQSLATRTQNETTLTVYPGEKKAQFKDGIKKFLSEAKTVAKFNHHKNIVTVRDFFTENGTAYIVMDYIEGVDLKDYVQSLARPLKFNEALTILNPIMDALQTIHDAGLLHRDISPDNIFITSDKTPILLDFGAARQFLNQDAGLSVILKPGYAPEEQYRRNGNSGPWSDLYAFSATFYHVITGKRPADSLDRMENDTLAPPSAFGVKIPSASEAALLKALSVKGANRYQSMRDFQSEINASMAFTQDAPTPKKSDKYNWGAANSQMPKASNKPKKIKSGRKSGAKTQSGKRSTLYKIIIAAASLVGVLLVVVVVVLFSDSSTSGNNAASQPAAQIEVDRPKPVMPVIETKDANSQADEQTDQNSGAAKQQVSSAPVTFTDPAFESMIKLALNKQSPLTTEDLAGIESLVIFGDKFAWINNETDDIVDYYGEDGYTINNLHYVSVGEIKRIDDLIHLPYIAEIYIIHNSIANLDGIVNAANLVFADFSYNSITDISPCNNAPSLREIEFAGNDYTGQLDNNNISIYDTDFMILNPYTYYGKLTAGIGHTLGIRADGTVDVQGTKTSNKKTEVEGWTDIVMVAAGADHSVGLKSDGTVVATGSNKTFGQCNVQSWVDITNIAAGETHTVGVKENGTVVAIGLNDEGQCDVGDWTDIVMVSAGTKHTLGLKEDGTVVATGHNGSGRCNVDDWSGIQFIAAGSKHSLGLKFDGTVVGTGWNEKNQLNKLTQWENVIAIAAGMNYSVAVNADGGMYLSGTVSRKIPDEKNVKYVFGAANSVLALKEDGSFKGFGDNTFGQNNIMDWTGTIFN